MFRRWLSNFYRKNKEKIASFAKIFGILILIGFALAHSISNNSSNSEENSETALYTPDKTIISGDNIDKDTYKQEENLVKTFVEYCNNQQIQEAYNLLTNECKEKMYPNIETFRNNYYDVIFNQNRECNLQSWVADGNYHTYKVTFIEDIMSTGNYENVEKFEDYITVATKSGEQKININSYIKTEEINKSTKTEDLEINVKNADVYMNSVKYFLEITNLTENDILLDTLKNKNVRLVGTNDAEYALDDSNLFSSNLVIYKNSKDRKVELKFTKQYGSEVKGKSIEFKKIITNYEEYLKDPDNYSEYNKTSIKL